MGRPPAGIVHRAFCPPMTRRRNSGTERGVMSSARDAPATKVAASKVHPIRTDPLNERRLPLIAPEGSDREKSSIAYARFLRPAMRQVNVSLRRINKPILRRASNSRAVGTIEAATALTG